MAEFIPADKDKDIIQIKPTENKFSIEELKKLLKYSVLDISNVDGTYVIITDAEAYDKLDTCFNPLATVLSSNLTMGDAILCKKQELEY